MNMNELTKESNVWAWRPQGIATTIHDGAPCKARSSMVVAIPCGRHAANDYQIISAMSIIAPLVPVEKGCANGLRGAINLAPMEAARFAAANNDRSLFPVYFFNLHSVAPTDASAEDGKGVQ